MYELARTLNLNTPLPEALKALTTGAVSAIPGADHASISVRHADGRLETVAPTHPMIDQLDARQYEFREGPCYDTLVGESFIVAFDLDRDPRWPKYGPVAAATGVQAQLAALLSTDGGGGRSALNIYAKEPHEFSSESIEIAQLFASHASVAIGFVRNFETLGAAITSRQIIGQAVGIVMERYHLTEERAFDFLLRVSSTSNVKLRTVAADIVAATEDHNAAQPADAS